MILGKIILVFLMTFILSFIFMIPVGFIVFAISEGIGLADITESALFTNISLIISNIAFISAVFITYRLFEKKSKFSLGWNQQKPVQNGIEGSLWGIIIITIPFLIVWVLGGIRILNISLDLPVLKGLIYGIILFFFVAVSEELLVRGYIQGIIKEHFGIKPAIIVGSLFFAALHMFNQNIFQTPIPLIVLLLAGILFGISREITGGLWIPIGIHFTWNLFQGNIYGFAVSGFEFGPSILEIEQKGHHLISGGGFGLEGSIVTTVFLILLIYVHWWYYTKKDKKRAA